MPFPATGGLGERSARGDRPLIVGAAVGAPQDGSGPGGRTARAVQSRAGAAVDDLVAAVTHAVQRPLLVVAAVPGRLPGRGPVRGVAPAVGDHAVGVVDDAVVAAAERDQLA